jgi:transcriptional antiterminator NusG
VRGILQQISEGKMRPKQKFSFDKGDSVRIIEGPFTNFNGVVDEVKPEKGRVKVLVSIFGRSTPIELEFLQVKKN